MLIILEGADGSGKTTLRHQFAEAGYVTKFTKPHAAINWRALWDLAHHTDVVVDRSFISDMVYRTVQRDSVRWDLPLEQAVHALDANTVIVYCKTKTQYVDSIQRGETNITDINTAKRISAFYDDFLHFISIFTDAAIIRYDWRNNSFDDLIKSLKDRRERVCNTTI